MPTWNLNHRAECVVDQALARADELRIAAVACPSGARIVDFGIEHRGGLEAGRLLAEICLAGLGTVRLAPAQDDSSANDPGAGWQVEVQTDQPLAACMASQYAGWQIAGENYFAMGSGPMRAAAGKEPLIDQLGAREAPSRVVGVLETRVLPPPAVCARIAADCDVAPAALTLCVAPTASQAGGVQIVARSVETALHKLHELGFDLARVESGAGHAPLPPVAKNDLRALGRTNDAVLYGGEVTLWVRGDDASLLELGPQVPSSASRDYGRPFREIFESYDRDFYRVDPLLFSPAVIRLINLDTGRQFHFGQTAPEILRASFA